MGYTDTGHCNEIDVDGPFGSALRRLDGCSCSRNLISSSSVLFVFVCSGFQCPLQEQYELVYNTVVELFKRQMDVIRDKHAGTEVNFKLDIFVEKFLSCLVLVKLQDNLELVTSLELECQVCRGLHYKSPLEKDNVNEVL